MARQQKICKYLTWMVGGAVVVAIAPPVVGLMTSVGEEGIDALRLHGEPFNITGEKIAIGQVELGRPSVFGLDKTAPVNRVVDVAQVFFRDDVAEADGLVDPHAANVASVMISQDKGLTGVAPDANLYSSAIGVLGR
ncbi:MAG: peptidase S8 and S53 subtilisin kexin sedolisin, partial [Cyanobacteria bacterium J06659_2]